MILVVYDISDDDLRIRFAKFLKRFGRRVQLSVFEIRNSFRTLENVIKGVENQFSNQFAASDSIIIYRMSDNSCVAKFGFSANEEENLVIW